MLHVILPWKSSHPVPLRPDQLDRIERDAHGRRFVRIRRADTGRLNKCYVVDGASMPPPKPKSPKPQSPKPKSPKSPKAPKSPKHKASPKHHAAKPPFSLTDLVGKTVTGTIQHTGGGFVAVIVDRVGSLERGVDLERTLVRLGAAYAPLWHMAMPRSWSIVWAPGRTVGPHVSLDSHVHMKDVGRTVRMRVVDVMRWTEDSRWVALRLEGDLVDNTHWHLHLSCAQQPI